MTSNADQKRVNTQIEDSLLAEKSRTWQSFFKDRVSLFEAFDSTLNMALADNWLLKIEAFEAHPSDENTLDLLQDKTQTLTEATDAAIAQVRDIEYFVTRAYPTEKRKLLEFGFEQLYKKRQKNFSDMVVQCFVLHRVLLPYAPALSAAGMPATLPAQYLLAVQALNEAMLDQEHFKRHRILLTTQRIQLFNELYAIHRTVAEAARIVFATNPAIAAQYA